jgi:hypothetical protein
MRRNQLGNAAKGSSRASAGSGSGSLPYDRQWRLGTGRAVIPLGPWPHFARSSHARIAVSASGSSGSGSAGSARCNRARLRLMEVAIADFAAGAGGAGCRHWREMELPALARQVAALPRFRTIAGPVSATAFCCLGGGL